MWADVAVSFLHAEVHLIYKFVCFFFFPQLIQTQVLFNHAHICVIALCSRSAPPLITRTNEQEQSSAFLLHLRLLLSRVLLTEQKPLTITSRRGPFHLSRDLEMPLFHVINNADGDGKNRLLPSLLEADLGTRTPDLRQAADSLPFGTFHQF